MPLRVLVLDDDLPLRRSIARHLKRRGAVTHAVGSVQEAVAALAERPFDALLLDLWLPDGSGLDVLEQLPRGIPRPRAIVMTGGATVESAVGALRIGVIDYLLKPFSNDALDAALARVAAADDAPTNGTLPDYAAAAAWARKYAPDVVGQHPAFLAVFDILRQVADTDCAILIQGETGTGKELVAQAAHAASNRSEGAFVAVNCAAVPVDLIESELFGHVRGAFTGASSARVGRFQEADGGTIFLDEVGEMPIVVQAKLLRALQEKEIAPLGSSKRTKIDVRVIAATNRDLEAAVADGTFRGDLLYRLDVIRVELPPLRERRQDIPLLVDRFVADTNARRGTAVTAVEPGALELLAAHEWPGNVRQLQNVIERIVLMRRTGRIVVADVPTKMRSQADSLGAAASIASPLLPAEGVDLFAAIERFETALIKQALERAGWNKHRAAEILGINRTTLVEKLKKRRRADENVVAGAPKSIGDLDAEPKA